MSKIFNITGRKPAPFRPGEVTVTANPRRAATRLVLIALSVGMGLSACSNQQAYEAIQQANQQECEMNPEYAREKCLRRVSEPYEQYEADRQAAKRENESPRQF